MRKRRGTIPLRSFAAPPNATRILRGGRIMAEPRTLTAETIAARRAGVQARGREQKR